MEMTLMVDGYAIRISADNKDAVIYVKDSGNTGLSIALTKKMAEIIAAGMSAAAQEVVE